MIANLTIFQKGSILIAAPLVFQCLFIAVMADMRRKNSEAHEWSLHTQEVIKQGQTILTALLDSESSNRGFTLTGNPEFLEFYEHLDRNLPREFQRLRDLVRDNPSQTKIAEQITGLALKLQQWRAESIRMMRQGERQAAVDRVVSLQGKSQMDALRREIGEFLAAEERLAAQRREALRQQERRMEWGLIAGGSLSAASAVGLAFVFSRGISGRLAQLEEHARRLAAGQGLGPPLRGRDEISRLDRAFREMAGSLAQSSEALRKQTGILESVLENMGDGVVVADATGSFTHFNPSAEQILGIGITNSLPSEWATRYGVFLPDGVTPCPASEVPLARAIRGETVDQVELFIRHAGLPRGIWISCSGRPIRNKEGQLQGGVVVFHNVTERKQAEAAIRALNNDLERRVQARTAELVEINRELNDKNQENAMFVYSVSHDLRSPLVNLQGFSQELALGCQDLRGVLSDPGVPARVRERGLALLDDEMAKSLEFIQTGVMRLSGIIDAMLRLSRAGRVEFQWQKVDLQATVDRVIDSMRPTIAERGATVSSLELPPVWGDGTALEQVFANLIGNALNYLDPARKGVILVGCEPANGAAHEEGAVGVQRSDVRDQSEPTNGAANEEDAARRAASGPARIAGPGGALSLASGAASPMRTYFVRDNGRGIPAAMLEKVFQAFQRAHPGAAAGEGIGLTMVRRIVERHRGRVWVESEVGIGSTFYVTLPTHDDDWPTSAEAAAT